MSERDDVKKGAEQSVVARESLSALMDDEANDLDLARSLRGVDESDALRRYWARQQLYRSSMLGTSLPHGAIDVSASVREAIVSEKRAYANPLVSMAVAASVTVAVVLGGQQALLLESQPGNAITAPGEVVQIPGSGAVQASFAESSLPQARIIQTTPVTEGGPKDVYLNRTAYNRLANERFESLSRLHNSTATAASITPFVSRSTDPRTTP
ncbi:MAG: sigma-E factor negative regulatory protein [Halieaceae bacterium]|nr:sigma-E factor negative regulatory protein [Halieaceae bacterium]MBT5135041.1 sigma-E factor negative regulatory protein [Halieaceae bacterium]MBT5557184.1 sigma-E factor negative regulatory protein [Halieaceae bacterium]MBT6180450.1 sigma-E factor negative regulatory protein [Halieaceae bacterium]MDG1800833.1 sigma-E factor negative regulatory protein [Luminiphilus sp.]